MERRTHQEVIDPLLVKRESHRVRHLLIKTSLVYVLISVGVYFIFSEMLRDHAYEDMSRDEVHHISKMAFASMYTAMILGQGKQGIDATIKRLNQTLPGMTISVVRGEVVESLFGEDKVDKMRRLNDLIIFDVFQTGQKNMVQKDESIRYLYPALFQENCQQCHTNSKPGQVAAVVEVIYPVTDLKVSTSYVNKLMMAYFSVSLLMLIIFINMTYRHRK